MAGALPRSRRAGDLAPFRTQGRRSALARLGHNRGFDRVYVDPSLSRVRVGDWADKWLETKTNLKPTTRRDYESLLHAHIVPRWGSMTLAEVKHEDITSWLADLSAHGLSASRVRAAHVALSQMLKLAVRSGRLARNPADYVPLQRVHRADKRYLTHDEVDALTDAPVSFDPSFSSLPTRASVSARWLPCAWADSICCVGAPRSARQWPRSPAAWYSARLRLTSHELFRFRASSSTSWLRWLSEGPSGSRLHRSEGCGAPAQPLPPLGVPAVEATGLTGLTPHGLRHTAASLAIASGADVKVVQTMLGHASATMTLDLYGHLYADRLDEIADRMDAARTARTVNSRTSAQDHADFLRTNGQLIKLPISADGLGPSKPGPPASSGRRESNPHLQFGRLRLCH